MKEKLKLFSIKETRLYVALALLIQSFTFFVMFVILCAKKKSIAAAFAAVSAAAGASSVLMLHRIKEETCADLDAIKESVENDELDFDPAKISADLAHGVDDGEHDHAEEMKEIPCEEHVSEDEFK